MGAGTALAPFQPVRGSGGGTTFAEGPGSRLPNPPPCTTLASETPDPKKGLALSGFHGKLGMEGGGPWT